MPIHRISCLAVLAASLLSGSLAAQPTDTDPANPPELIELTGIQELGFHAVKTFDYNPFFGKDWEAKQIQKYMEEDKKEMDKYR